MKIDRSGGKLRVSHELLNIRKIHTLTQQMSSKRMTKRVTRERLITRKHLREFLKIPAYSRFHTRFTKIRWMMGDDRIRFCCNLPEDTIPQPRNRSVTSIQVLLKQFLDRRLEESSPLFFSLTSKQERTRHDIGNLKGKNLKQTETRSSTNKANKFKAELIDKIVVVLINKIHDMLQLSKIEKIHTLRLSTGDMNQIRRHSHLIVVVSKGEKILHRLNLFFNGLRRQLLTLSIVPGSDGTRSIYQGKLVLLNNGDGDILYIEQI